MPKKASIPPEWRDCSVILETPHCNACRTYRSLCRDDNAQDYLVTRSMVEMMLEQENGTVLFDFQKRIEAMEARLKAMEEKI